MNRDYLALSDEKLVNLLQIVYDTTEAHLTEWLISAFELTAWKPELTAFVDAVNTRKDPAKRSPVTTRIKNDARDALKKKVRPFIQGRLVHNPMVTPASLTAMGLHVRDTHLTPKPKPHRRPALSVQPTNSRQHTVLALNQETGKKTKPDDAYGVKYAWEIRETPPADPADLRWSVFSRKTTHIFDFEEKDRGKRVYYAARYENAKGEAGPWSDIVDFFIP